MRNRLREAYASLVYATVGIEDALTQFRVLGIDRDGIDNPDACMPQAMIACEDAFNKLKEAKELMNG